MVRLKDIAAKAGVSIMTVSKVMRDAHDVSAATKARVRQIAQQMGYSPDLTAQGLRTRTTKLLGLVVPAVTHPIFARAVQAVEQESFELGFSVILAQTFNETAREDSQLRRLLARRAEGLIVAPVYRLSPQAAVYQEILLSKTPCVILGHKAPFCEMFANVETEDVLASAQATQHLVELGHRRIAFFAGPAAAPWAQERFEGYRRALREANVPFDERLVFNAGASPEEGEKAALQMLDERSRATAVQAASDQSALGAADVLLRQGLKIPEEVSIIGFGNVAAGEYFRVPLTTVRQPKFRLGSAAVQALWRLLRGEPAPSRRLPAELLVRSSTGPAPLQGASENYLVEMERSDL